MGGAVEQQRPIFVGGSVRSGTTLLRVMLHSHPDLAVPREIHLTLETFRQRRRFGDLRTDKNRAALIEWMITSRNGFKRLGLDKAAARTALGEASPTIGSFIQTLLNLYAEQHDAPRYGEKRPLNVNAHPALFAMFPTLQFIEIVRDPRAVVASMRKLGWLEKWHGGSVVRALDAWARAVQSGTRIEASYRADQYLRVRYEDLITDPEPELSRICDWSGLNADGVDQMLRFHETKHEIPSQRQARLHPLIESPVTAARADSWRTELSGEEIALIEKAVTAEMERFGYERTAPGPRVSVGKMAEWTGLRVIRPARRSRWIPASPFYRYPVAAEPRPD